MAEVISFATSASIARPNSLFWKALITDRSLPITASTICGFMTTPSFAMPADTIAICSGVAVTCPCPKPLSAVCASSSARG